MSVIIRPKRWSLKPGLGAQINRGHPLANGLIGCYLLNEGAGSVAIDLAGRVGNGVLDPLASRTTGRYGSQASFTGASPSQILTPAVLLGNDTTAVVLCKPGFSGTAPAYVRIMTTSFSDGLFLGMEVSTTQYRILGYSSVGLVGPVGGSFSQNKWNMVGGSITKGGIGYLYVDGVMVNSAAVGSGTPTSRALHIGGSELNSNEFFQGDIAVAYLWNRILTNSEHQQLYVDPYSFIQAPAGNRRYFVVPAGGGTTYSQGLTATMGSWAGLVNKSPGKLLTATPNSWAGSVVKRTSRALAATPNTWAGLVNKLTFRVLKGTRWNLFDFSERLQYFGNDGVGYNIQDVIAAPDGNITADTAREDAGTFEHYFSKFMGLGAGTYTLSFYFKKATGNNWATIRCDIDGVSTRTWFDIFNGVIGTQGHASAAITNAGSGWWRCSVSFTSSSSLTNPGCGFASSGNSVFSYAGSTSNTMYVWGAQVELASSVGRYQMMPDQAPVMGLWAGVLAGIKNGATYTATLTASMGSWAGAVTKRTSRSLAATPSTWAGTVNRFTSKFITATPSAWAGAIAGVRVKVLALTATMGSWSGSVSKLTSHLLIATPSAWAGSVSKQARKALTASAGTWAGNVSKLVGKGLSATASTFSAAISSARFKVLVFTASMGTWSGTVTKRTLRSFAATPSAWAGAVVKQANKTLTATPSAWSAVLSGVRVKVLAFTASMGTWSGTVTKRTLRSIAATPDIWAGVINKRVNKTLTAASASWSATLATLRFKIVSFSASMGTWSGGITKRTLRSLAATPSAWSGAVNKLTKRAFNATPNPFSAVLGLSFIQAVFNFTVNLFLAVKMRRDMIDSRPARVIRDKRPANRTFGAPMSQLTQYDQDRREIIDYHCDVITEDDTISSVAWAVTPPGPAITVTTITGSNVATARVVTTAAVDGVIYLLTALISGASGQKYVKSCKIRVTPQ